MIEELIQKLNISMEAVQNLQIQPTEYNVKRILQSLQAMREAGAIAREMARKIDEMSKEKETKEGAEV